ncbi:MAG: DUF4910 domain-containing protein [Rhodospirillales bacterium]|nr:DUF4910 domain-containing protein [Rhodospirillales bacterium]
MNFDNVEDSEKKISEIFDRLFPLFRSITGKGTLDSYRILQEYMPLEISRVTSGTKVFDWTVPQEWHCEEAYLLGPGGETVVDMKDSNLHVVNYAAPIDVKLGLNDLQDHIYSIPEKPDAIPYVTSYYKKHWGFCMSDRQRQSLREGEYRAVIKSEFLDGGIDIAQTKLAGRLNKKILISSYLCHPSLANNELSGPLTLLGLYHRIRKWPSRNYTFLFSIQPETIGTLCMLHLHLDEIKNSVVGGMILNMLGGDTDRLTYKYSLFKDGLIDKAVTHAVKNGGVLNTVDFNPNHGADERHYATPGVRVPVCNVSRDFYSPEYIGYHNSLDTKDYMQVRQILNSIDDIEHILKIADSCVTYENLESVGEPQLGPRGLYPTLNFVYGKIEDDEQSAAEELRRIKWLLTLSDGRHDLFDISTISGYAPVKLQETALKLESHGLIKFLEI